MSVPAETIWCDGRCVGCRCIELVGHAGPCQCDCGGQWQFDEDGKLHQYALPGSAPLETIANGLRRSVL